MPKQIKLLAIAENPVEQAHGLKYIAHMDAGMGMLFKFKAPQILNFWMAETWLPLQIAFIDKDNMIVKTEQMIPLSLRTVSSGRPCVMALEVPAGTFGDVIGKKIVLDAENKQVIIND